MRLYEEAYDWHITKAKNCDYHYDPQCVAEKVAETWMGLAKKEENGKGDETRALNWKYVRAAEYYANAAEWYARARNCYYFLIEAAKKAKLAADYVEEWSSGDRDKVVEAKKHMQRANEAAGIK